MKMYSRNDRHDIRSRVQFQDFTFPLKSRYLEVWLMVIVVL